MLPCCILSGGHWEAAIAHQRLLAFLGHHSHPTAHFTSSSMLLTGSVGEPNSPAMRIREAMVTVNRCRLHPRIWLIEHVVTN